MGRLGVLVACILLMFFASACATIPQKSSSDASGKPAEPLTVAPLLKFEDVPVPSGFVPLDKESFAFQNDRNRVALLKYTGPKPADRVVEFYKEQMASFNWDMVNITEYDKRVLNYENSGETCIITIEPQGKRSIIVISLSPKSRPIKVEKEKDKENYK